MAIGSANRHIAKIRQSIEANPSENCIHTKDDQLLYWQLSLRDYFRIRHDATEERSISWGDLWQK